ncbi:MAG: hypothetical protein ACYDHY_06600 [Acidiferrobacterales bacterium]
MSLHILDEPPFPDGISKDGGPVFQEWLKKVSPLIDEIRKARFPEHAEHEVREQQDHYNDVFYQASSVICDCGSTYVLQREMFNSPSPYIVHG